MNGRLRLAVVGLGWSGRRWIEVIRRSPDAELSAVVPGSGSGGDLPVPAATARCPDIYRALSKPELDAVIVCTPPHNQVALATAAIQTGKAVLLEKPGGLEPGPLCALADEAARRGVPCLAAYHLAANPRLGVLMDRLAEGAFGRPERAYFRMHVTRERPRPAWLGDPARSGGIMVETLVHGFHLALCALGPVTRIETAVHSQDPAAPDASAVAVLRHASGAISTLEAAWRGSPAVRSGFFEVLCSAGGFGMDRGFAGARSYRYRAEQRGRCTEEFDPDDDRGFSQLLVLLARAARGDQSAARRVSLSSAVQSLRLAVAARGLAAGNRGLHVEPVSAQPMRQLA